ncbi:MAG: Rpn family recombination-promoting nuclease/putative transposase [Defluviitaleaceae bacterium]|nr:Rpn family recombination-promoting nuclease/putative transposase [Defluviitaleaceae bacterium]MCL2264089.1 Rpn family recombination-promoting nuclease/putative transposase [Defluviitaleaceae bacterium]
MNVEIIMAVDYNFIIDSGFRREVYGLAGIHKAKDNSVKAMLSEPELFAEFLRNFIPVEILKDVAPSDIEDVSDRLLSLVSEQKDGDTIKRINLKDGKPLFVIAIVEHESKVNFRAPFKMLMYIALILDDYEKEANKKAGKKISYTKDFKYPPILPIIFYDGEDEWTAETNFLYRTEMHDIFEKYIPEFEYELVSLKDYSFTDLAKFGDMLSLFMMMDKLKTPEDLSNWGKLPKEYIHQLSEMNVPPHLLELLVKVITVLLRKIDVSQDEINKFVEKIDERGVSEMLTLENYSVQETRRAARAEADRERQKAENLLKSAIQSLLSKGNTVTEVADMMGVTERDVTNLLP